MKKIIVAIAVAMALFAGCSSLPKGDYIKAANVYGIEARGTQIGIYEVNDAKDKIIKLRVYEAQFMGNKIKFKKYLGYVGEDGKFHPAKEGK